MRIWWCKRIGEYLKLRRWERAGRPDPPPPLAKQAVLREFAQRFKLDVLVETGTFLGDTVAAMRGQFRRIYSVELSSELHARACRRFAGDSAIELIQGDSGKVLSDLVGRLDGPTLFWLDGHYSGGNTALGDLHSPVWAELKAVFGGMRHPFVILIDDARCFHAVGGEDYPAVDDIRRWVHDQRPDFQVEVVMDCIRIFPAVV